jgi:hypothetical protein
VRLQIPNQPWDKKYAEAENIILFYHYGAGGVWCDNYVTIRWAAVVFCCGRGLRMGTASLWSDKLFGMWYGAKLDRFDQLLNIGK